MAGVWGAGDDGLAGVGGTGDDVVMGGCCASEYGGRADGVMGSVPGEHGGSTDDGARGAGARIRVCGVILSCNGLLALLTLPLIADNSNGPPRFDCGVCCFLGEPGVVGFWGV